MFREVRGRTFSRGFIISTFMSLALSLYGQRPALPGQVSIEGKQLMRDGKPWIPHGFFQIAFAVPPAAFGLTIDGKKPNPNFQNAYANYDSSEYHEMKRAGADSVRMNVAQDGADPMNAYYFDRQWFNTVVKAVKAARNAGLTVILSIQNEKQTGSAGAALPNAATLRVWRELAPVFASDHGVLFELYNEPGEPESTVPSREQWDAWAAAMNKVVTLIRALGSRNVLVADGLGLAQQLTGAPPLNDPLGQVAYASHPYPHNGAGENSTTWDQKFGLFAEKAPVIVTEWGVGYFCDASTTSPNGVTNSVLSFLSYLQQHNVGLEAVAWDWGEFDFASAVQGFPKPVFSSLTTLATPSACTTSTKNTPGMGSGPGTAFGPGKVIRDWYLTGTVPASPE